MEEISWRAKLAKSNINILSITPSHWVYEFTYHPKPNIFKWCKTVHEVRPAITVPEDPVLWEKRERSYEEIAEDILREVLNLRKELEG